MTKLAQTRYKAYQRQQEETRQRFIARIKALTPEQKKEVLVQAGVLTKQGRFTAYYRSAAPTRPKRRKVATR